MSRKSATGSAMALRLRQSAVPVRRGEKGRVDSTRPLVRAAKKDAC